MNKKNESALNHLYSKKLSSFPFSLLFFLSFVDVTLDSGNNQTDFKPNIKLINQKKIIIKLPPVIYCNNILDL